MAKRTVPIPTLDVEFGLIREGSDTVIALDEVGRGALAGPVSVAAVVWTATRPDPPPGIRDSKELSESRREALVEPIREWVADVSVGHIDAGHIDTHGIVSALRGAAERALIDLRGRGAVGSTPIILLDGSHNWLAGSEVVTEVVITRPRADRECLSVAAASIVAKVERDRVMRELAATFPEYGFDRHKGYGAPGHFDALARHGVTIHHRASWIDPAKCRILED